MSNTPLVSTDVARIVQQLSPYVEHAFHSKIADYQAAFAGAIDFFPPSAEVKPGSICENPRFVYQGTVARYDQTSASAVDSAAGPTSVRGSGPVRTFAPAHALEFTHMASRGYKKSEEELLIEMATSFGQGAARFAKQSLYYALRGTVAAQSTGGQHLYDLSESTAGTLTMAKIETARAKLGDRGSEVVGLLCHSAVARSLRNDIISGSNSGGLLRVVVENGDSVQRGLEAIGNMRIFVDDDLPSGLVTEGIIGYRSFLLCRRAAWVMPGLNSPMLTMTPDLLERPIRSRRASVEGVFGIGVYGMNWTATGASSYANPSDANLYAATYWEEAYSHDHRDFGVVEIYGGNG